MPQAKTSKSEVTKLKAENAKLKKQNEVLSSEVSKMSKARGKFSTNLLRAVGSAIFVTLACLFLLAGNLAFWTGNTAVNQTRFDNATQPIIRNTNVTHAIALYTTNTIFSNININKITTEVLPPRASFLAAPLAKQVQSLTLSTLNTGFTNQKFQTFWNKTLSTQHQQLITFIKNYKGNGAISINDVYKQLSQTLATTPLKFLANKTIPSKIGTITVVNASWLPFAHDVVVNITLWRFLAIIFTLLCLVAAVLISRHRRRTVEIIGVAIAASMIITLIALRIAIQIVVHNINPQYQAGVESAIHIFTSSLKVQTITIGLIGLVISLIAWLSGSGPSAQKVKATTLNFSASSVQTRIQKSKFASVLPWTNRHVNQLSWGAVVLFGIILLFIRPTPKTLLVLVILLLLVEFIIQLLGRSSESKKIIAKR